MYICAVMYTCTQKITIYSKSGQFLFLSVKGSGDQNSIYMSKMNENYFSSTHKWSVYVHTCMYIGSVLVLRMYMSYYMTNAKHWQVSEGTVEGITHPFCLPLLQRRQLAHVPFPHQTPKSNG